MCFCPASSYAQWSTFYASDVSGNKLSDPQAIAITSDGGYIVAGGGSNFIPPNTTESFFVVMKLDSRGSITWQKRYDGRAVLGSSVARSVQQTTDGGYIVAGYSGYTPNDYNYYNVLWVMKLDATGAVQWSKTHNGSSGANAVRQTADGGYIVAGYTKPDLDTPDMWIIKLDASGTIMWQRMLGGADREEASDVRQAADGGYIVAGYRGAYPSAIWIVKFYPDGTGGEDGTIQWQKSYGQGTFQKAWAVRQTLDGGYIIAGSIEIDNGDPWNSQYGYVISKLDSDGAIQWQKTYDAGNIRGDKPADIRQTADGGYIVAGTTVSSAWLLKLYPDGTDGQDGAIQWQKAYGNAAGVSVQPGAAGGYTVLGSYLTYGGTWVGKLMPDGTTDSSCNAYHPVSDTDAAAADSGLSTTDTAEVARSDNETLEDFVPPTEDTLFQEITCGVSEVCANGIDDDADGQTDCNDPECCTDAVCAGIPPCATVSTSETLYSRQALMQNALLSGGVFNSTLDFSSLDIVQITTGEFAGKGFSSGECTTTIEGATYQGDWSGMLFFDPETSTLYLKGTIAGEIQAAVEAVLTESVPGSGTYDQYQGLWRIAALGSTAVSTTVTISGTLSYQDSTQYPDTGLYIMQDDFAGTELGDYGGYLKTVVTHVRVVDQASPYNGEGFSTLYYTSDYGSGQGWTSDTLAFTDVVDMRGIFSNPLFGMVSATLDESASPRALSLSVQRVDLELPPMPDIQIKAWGPWSVSPGQTIDLMVQYRNDGSVTAQDVVVALSLPDLTEYVSSTGGGMYRFETHDVIWKTGPLAAQAGGIVSAKVTLLWGLKAHSLHPALAVYATTTQDRNHYVQPGYDDLADSQEYRDYQPLEITAADMVALEDMDLLLSSDARLDELYQYAVSEGFSDPSAMELATSEGPLTIVLMKNAGGEVRMVAADSTRAMLVKYSDTSVSFYDPDGGISLLFDNGTLETWGAWAGSPAIAPSGFSSRRAPAADPVCPSLSQCIKNCFRDKLTSWLLGKLVKAVSQVSQTTDCWKCTYNKDALSCSKCLGSIKQLPVVGEITDGIECFRDCVDDPGKHCCSKDKKTCEIWPFSWLPIKKSAQLVRCDMATGRYKWPPETIEFPDSSCGKCVGGEIVPRRKDGNCDWGIPDLRVNNCADESCRKDRPVPEIIVANDPNIKYGPDGPVAAGQQLDYMVEYENVGAGIAFGVYVTDVLDEDLDETTLSIGPVRDVADDSLIAPPGSYDNRTRTITWFAGEVGPGEGGYADVSVQVRDNATRGTEIINFATIYFPSVPQETRTNAVVSWIPLEICDNGIDDDNDTDIDCADAECFSPDCAEDCDDGRDNDGDGFADCADRDCPACPEVDCDDTLDNDNDTLTDCADPDCFGVDCAEVCDDAQDNDGDGAADCLDADCAADASCVTTTTSAASTSTTTSTKPSTTTTKPSTTTTKPSTTTTKPSTTTTAASTTTTTASGGGGTTTSSSTTTTAACLEDADCDDAVFCNGTEQCDNGTCVAGQDPCEGEAACSEEQGRCREHVEVSAHCLQQYVLRPVMRDQRCLWLVIIAAAGHHASPHSAVELEGPTAGAGGVDPDAQRGLLVLGRLILVPVCVEQSATAGSWVLTITSEVDAATPASYQEFMRAEFSLP